MTREEKIQVILEAMLSSEEDNIMLAAAYDPEQNVMTASILLDNEEEKELFTIEGDARSTPESLKGEFESIMNAALSIARQLATSPLN